MLVNNKYQRIHAVALSGNDRKLLLPGFNEVEPKVWEAMKNNPLTKKRIDAGMLVGQEPPKVVEPVKPASKVAEPPKVVEPEYPLAGINYKDAEKIVEETFDVELLNKWSELDERVTVKTAIQKQIKLIEEAGAEEDKDE